MRTSWTALFIGAMTVAQIIIHISYGFSLLRPAAPGYILFQAMGLMVSIPATIGLGIGFRMARKDALRDCMAHTLPVGLAGGVLGFCVFLLYPGLPERTDLGFVIWVLLFLTSFGLFFLSKQLYNRFRSGA